MREYIQNLARELRGEETDPRKIQQERQMLQRMLKDSEAVRSIELAQQVPDARRPEDTYGSIEAPRHPLVAKGAEFAQDVGRRVEGSSGEFFLPGEGVGNWLNKLAYGEKPGAMDRLGAGGDLADIIPGVGTALGAAAMIPAKATRSTIRAAERKYKPGIYKGPDQLLEEASARVAPEDPALFDVFGVTRQDLSDIGKSRQGNQDVQLKGAAARPKGTAHGEKVMAPANTRRLVDSLENARGSELEKGMTGWYVMDPAYQRLVELVGPEEAQRRYSKLNTLTGIHSANSDVVTELNRGTGAYYLDEQGRIADYVKYGGKGGQPGAPGDMDRIKGHMGHKTSHGVPTRQYLESGELQMGSPKVPAYIQASGVPETGFQTSFPVGDAHYSRAIGLSDVRPNESGKLDVGASWSMPEAQQLAPWWRDEVASKVDLESVPAQALAWGLFGPQTGVTTMIGAPKLELLATEIVKLAKKRGITPAEARDRVLLGKDYVGSATPEMLATIAAAMGVGVGATGLLGDSDPE